MRAEKWMDVSQEKNVSEAPARTGRSFYVFALHYNPRCSSLLWYFLPLPFAMIMRHPCAVFKKFMYDADAICHISLGLKSNQRSHKTGQNGCALLRYWEEKPPPAMCPI